MLAVREIAVSLREGVACAPWDEQPLSDARRLVPWLPVWPGHSKQQTAIAALPDGAVGELVAAAGAAVTDQLGVAAVSAR
jgi:hypothetical protein